MNLTFRPVILAKLRCLISMRNYRQSAKNIKAGYNFINGYYKLGNSVKLFATFMATGWCVTRFLAEPILLQGPSMEPTIQNNDIIIMNKFTTIFKKDDYKRGDIVVVRSPMNPHQFICKRIAALPGDTIGQRYHFNSFRQTVPSGHVWLLGDNKSNSTDSREFGPLPMGLIIGIVIYRIWPLNRLVKFQNDNDNYKFDE